MAHQEPRQRMGIGRDVEDFVAADAGKRAGGDVANGISASLAGCDADRRQPPHDRGPVLDVDEMELKILARGDVRDAVGIFLGQFRHRLELPRVKPAERNLDPQHARRVPHRVWSFARLVGIRQLAALGAVVALAVVVALAIGATAQTRLGEHLFVDLPLLAQIDFRFKLVNFTADRLGQFAPELFLPNGVAGFHGQ